VTFNAAFAGSFQDPAKGQEIATQMYQGGVDFIQTDGAATDGGVIAAANEGAGRLVSGISPAQHKLGPKSVVALVSLDFGQSLYNEVSRTFDGSWKGGHLKTGLGTGVIDFVLSPVFQEQGPPDNAAKAKAVWPQIEKAKAGILDGSLKVPFNATL
jgi:basic membrane protein A